MVTDDAVTYDETTALVVVDVQNDFADPAGSLYVDGGEAVVLGANQEVERAVAAGATVVYTQDWHPPSTPHFEKDGGTWPVHCVRDSWGAQLHPDLKVEGATVKKGVGGEDGYSGFTVRDPETGDESPTDLEAHLREADVTKVVVVGLATDYCVKETAVDSSRKGFQTTVLSDVMRGVNVQAGDDKQALAAMAEAGAIVI